MFWICCDTAKGLRTHSWFYFNNNLCFIFQRSIVHWQFCICFVESLLHNWFGCFESFNYNYVFKVQAFEMTYAFFQFCFLLFWRDQMCMFLFSNFIFTKQWWNHFDDFQCIKRICEHEMTIKCCDVMWKIHLLDESTKACFESFKNLKVHFFNSIYKIQSWKN